jgi:hypothetical protein
MGITERETDLIISKIEDLRSDFLSFKQEDFKSFREEVDTRLGSIGELLQVHNGRMDDFETKQIEDKIKFKSWYEENKKNHELINQQKEKREKRYSWIIPMIVAIFVGLVSLILSFLSLFSK